MGVSKCHKSRIVRAAVYCIVNSKELNTNSDEKVTLGLKTQPLCAGLMLLLLLRRHI